MTTGNKIINLLFAPLIIAVAAFGIYKLVSSRKEPPPRKPQVAISRVSVIESNPADARPTISTYGNVRTYYATQVAGQVGGRIESIAAEFDAGRAVRTGDLLAKIEDADYRSALAERESAVAAARQTLAEEKTRSQIAGEDWLASGRKLADAPDYTLRKPQLAAAEAALEAAEAATDQAQLNLQRTEIRAPFDAIVQSREASPGNVVAAGTSLGSLISRDKVEVRLPLTPAQVVRLDLPLAFVPGSNPALEATLHSPSLPGSEWQARITRTEAAIDPQNQTIYVIAEVSDPFENGDAVLPVGTFVTAKINGATLPAVHELPDASLVEDSYVWVVDPENKLRRQALERLFNEDGKFLARIAEPVAEMPLKVVTRPLASFRDGAAVVIENPSSNNDQP
ncbi:efflux RND transporter periplasmic adaptor subunit [Haloferula chungangensis]|uniref:Efflux RND transporter periplasmic adaptor subunit n=1 Tax=Haloferula chungangensis TaxID=1048331 RepID=A0ABW2L827_9BACT